MIRTLLFSGLLALVGPATALSAPESTGASPEVAPAAVSTRDSTAARPDARALEAVRTGARERLRQVTLRDWDLRTRGTASGSSGTAPDSNEVRAALAVVREAVAAADSADRRALRHLEDFLVMEAARNASAGAPPELRPALEDSVVRALGCGDYVTFSQRCRDVRLADLMAGAFRFIRETNLMYRTLVTELTRELPDRTGTGPSAADLARILEKDPADAAFPPALMKAAFQEFLAGMGLSLATPGGGEIRMDISDRPAKNARGACLVVDVPEDIRISLKPVSGLQDYRTLFHEGGHAVYAAQAPAAPWELSLLGSAAVTEAVGTLFAGAWSDPAWLAHYREFARAAGQSKAAEALSDLEIARIGRRQLLRDLYAFRRYAGAQILFSVIVHDADPELYRPYFFEAEDVPRQELYRQISGFAAGVDLTAAEVGPYTEDLDPFLYAADYVRGFALSALMEEQFRQRFGGDWFRNPDAGDWLRRELFSRGNSRSVDEVAGLLGAEPLTFEQLKAGLTRRFAETEAALEAGRR